jgi:replication factor C subunit 1
MNKDALLRLDGFSAAPKLFTDARTASLDARMDLFFVDYDWVPLLVQQSYVQCVERATTMDNVAKLFRISK